MGNPAKIETNFDFRKNQVKNFVHDNQNSAPSLPVEGQEYYNTETKKKQYWNGTKWVIPPETASDAEIEAGTSEIAAVNPKQLKTALAAKEDALGYTPENNSNKVTSLSSSSTDIQYPSAKLLYDSLASKAPIASPEFTGAPKAPTPVSGDNSTRIATTAFVNTAISAAMTGGLIYMGTWDTSSASDYSALNSYRPIKKGYIFRCTGSGCIIDSTDYKEGDTIIFNRDVSENTAITTAMIDKFDHTENEDTVLLNAVQTLTNKTINAGNNTISNLALSMFASGVILTALSNNPSDTALLTEKAVNTLLALKAPLNSPEFTGAPKAPTPVSGDNSTRIANTAFVKTALDNASAGIVKRESYTNPSLTPSSGVCTWQINHTLGSKDVIAEIYEVSTGDKVIMSAKAVSSTVFQIEFNSSGAAAANTYKAVLLS